MWITIFIRFVIKIIVMLSVQMCVCRVQRQNMDNLLCLRPVVLFTKDFAYSSYRLSSEIKLVKLSLIL